MDSITYVLFDFDGTLTRPGSLDFNKIKTAIGCPENAPMLEYIKSIPHPAKQKKAALILDQMEMAAAVADTFREGGELLVEAGTGTGKTLAYLIPAVLSGQRVVISTGTKNLQEQLF